MAHQNAEPLTEELPRLDLKIVSARRRHPHAKIWDVEGIIDTPGGKKPILLYYISDTNKDYVELEEELRSKGIMETPTSSRKTKALMIIIQKMIAEYRGYQNNNKLSEEMFKLFEKAKKVDRAEDPHSLFRAIEDI